MYPLKLQPLYDKTIWANNRLSTMRGLKETGIGTSWEISAHPYAKNVIINGPYANQTLYDLVQKDQQAMLGEKTPAQLLRVAFLDAKDDLSIQVHPYDEYAHEHENDEGKTEAWYILAADEGATLVAGTTNPDRQVIKDAVDNDHVEDYVRKVNVSAGDFICIDAGMLHALGKGIVALEVGQNSNITYRFYDYHRKNPDGSERPLHIKKSFDVADFTLEANKVVSPVLDHWQDQTKTLVDRREFTVLQADIESSYTLHNDHKRFYCLSNVGKDCVIRCHGEELPFAYTESIFIPAACDDVEIIGNTRVLISFVR